MQQWLGMYGYEPGATLTTSQLGALSQKWESDKLDPSWRPRSVAGWQAILDGLGLTGPFWQIPVNGAGGDHDEE